jgi:hypothetical protein
LQQRPVIVLWTRVFGSNFNVYIVRGLSFAQLIDLNNEVKH